MPLSSTQRKYGMFNSIEERRAYDREWYGKQPAAYRERRQRLVNARRLRITTALWEHKAAHPCVCGESDPVCLDFHHTSDDKELAIADAVQKGWGLERIMREVAKCVVICANCHRKLHGRNGLDDPI